MKTYQLKIIIKKTKPPVWWRVIVPAGITFSTLAFLLDGLTQNEPNNRFLFEFYRKVHLFEASENVPLKPRNPECDAREASDTFIDDYFDVEKWVSYSQNGTSYRVEIESTGDNDPHNSLLLLKTTADNGSEVNNSLLSNYTVSEGEPSFVKYSEITTAPNGKYHILSSKTPKSSPDNIALSVMTEMGKMGELIRKAMGLDDTMPLDKYIIQMPKDYLLDVTRDLGIRTKTSDNKETLAVKIKEYIMEPQNFEQMILTLSDEEMKLFETIASFHGLPMKSEEVSFEHEIFYSIVFINKAHYAFIPAEVVKLYNDIKGTKLQNKRRQAQWILAVSNKILNCYYGYMPMQKFNRLCRRKADPTITPDDVSGILKVIPWYAKDFLLRDGNIVGSIFLDYEKNYKALQRMRADKSYYIVRENEIQEVLTYGYPYRESHYAHLRNWLNKRHGGAEHLIVRLHTRFALGHGLVELDHVFEEEGVRFTKKELKELIPIIQDICNHTRTLMNCGHTPEEMSAREKDNIIPFSFGLM